MLKTPIAESSGAIKGAAGVAGSLLTFLTASVQPLLYCIGRVSEASLGCLRALIAGEEVSHVVTLCVFFRRASWRKRLSLL